MEIVSAAFLPYVALMLAAGALTGVLAGLFGVGGGAIIVPVLFEVFRVLEVPEDVRMPLAVGTSLAIIIPTSIRSYRAHKARGAVDEALLRAWALPILAGVACGAVIARYAPAQVFQAVFAVVAAILATKLLTGTKRWDIAPDLPRGPALAGWGGGIGLVASLMGIGGGGVSNMIMSLHGRAIHQAVATSAGIGVLISISGAIGYVLAGLGREGLPPDAVGFVSILGLVLFAPAAVLTAGLGVRIAHALPRRTLELAFGSFLALASLRFAVEVLSG
jgi:uncharacterized protein